MTEVIYYTPTYVSCPHYVGSIFSRTADSDTHLHSILNSRPATLPAGVTNLNVPGHDCESIWETKQGVILFLNLLSSKGVTHVIDWETFEDDDLHSLADYENNIMSCY